MRREAASVSRGHTPRRRVSAGHPSHSGRRRRQAGELEEEVLAALGAAADPVTPTQLHAALGRRWAYNTVHTVLTRLIGKHLVVRLPRGARGVYACAAGGVQLAAEQMSAALAASTDRAAVLRRFAGSLSEPDRHLLRSALDPAGLPGQAESSPAMVSHPSASTMSVVVMRSEAADV